MKIEKIINKESTRCINVAASKVESLRINNDLQNTVRVYDKNLIGVQGSLGRADFDELEKAAAAKLAQGIPYPETHDKVQVLNIDTAKFIFDKKDFIPKTAALLERLARENPDFLFSNKLFLSSVEKHYENSDGTKLDYKGNEYALGLAIKFKGSANIMDEFYGATSDYYDEDEICRDIKLECDAFLNNIPQIEEDEAIIIGSYEPIQYALEHFIADIYFNKSSLLDGKLGQKIFNDKLSVLINRDPETQLAIPFFDEEGVINEGYKNYLIKNGVFEKTVSCKKSAAQYGCENLGSASAPYNGVPGIGAGGFEAENTANTLEELLKGRKAVYLSNTGGGDMTPSGDLSIPSIVSYLYQDGKLVGKLPEFTVTGNLFDILGKDFIGVCKNGFFKFGRQKYFVYKAKLVNKQ